VEVRLLLQPFSEGSQVGPALAERADSANALWILTAWAQASGLDHLRAVVDSIRQREGRTEAIIGLDQGIATYEGLRLALELFDDVFLFHDGQRTFHPKLYVIENDAQARLIIGSSNVTEGGLYRNFEASAVVDLDRGELLDDAMRQRVREYFETFIAQGMPFRRLDSGLLRELRAGGAVGSAASRRRTEQDRRRREQPVLRRIFGSGVTGLPGAPAVSGGRRRTRRRARQQAGAGAGTGGGTIPTGAIAASWWKKLTMSDVMRKPATSNQRKYVVLGKAKHPIDKETYFVQHLFAGVPWAQQGMLTGNVKEFAVIPFDVRIGRRRLGILNISVDHAENRIANQGNAPTYLNWSSLRNEILSRDYTGWYLVIERYSSGGFRLTLTRTQPGPAVVPAAARV
jgi:hypothetical protein